MENSNYVNLENSKFASQFLHLLALRERSEPKGQPPNTMCYNWPQMTFGEKVKFLRSLPQFKVVPISEVRAIAFAAKEKKGRLVLDPEDVEKIVREYPDLKAKLI